MSAPPLPLRYGIIVALVLSLTACGSVSEQAFPDNDKDGFDQRTDCDDTDPAIHPEADEVCDEVDNDCDELVDVDDSDVVDAGTWYADEDGDGYGALNKERVACTQPVDAVDDTSDCDDDDPLVSPEAIESCLTSVDDDCDGVANPADSADCQLFYLDEDGDDFGVDETACLCAPMSPYDAFVAEDCDDTDATINPEAEEICGDGVDQNCDDSAEGCRVEQNVSTADATITWQGDWNEMQLGGGLCAGGDVDGDGVDDVFLGAPGGVDETGGLFLLHGGSPVDGQMPSDADAIVRLGDGATFGATCAGDADWDQDGFADVVVGHADEGLASLFLGPLSGTLQGGDEVLALSGGAGFGEAVTFGDLDGDGWEDLVVVDVAAGEILVGINNQASGIDELSLTGDDVVDAAVAAVGDTDGDGIGDLWIGLPQASFGGAAYLVAGAVESGILDDAEAIVTGRRTDDLAGDSVAAAGDVNGDGKADVLIGAPENGDEGSRAGRVYLLYGPLTSMALDESPDGATGGSGRDFAGSSLAGGVDLDGDGYVELLVGAPGNDGGGDTAGAVHVIYGPLSGITDLAISEGEILGAAGGDELGTSIAVVGDLDDNGMPDFALGAPIAAGGGTQAGEVTLWLSLGL